MSLPFLDIIYLPSIYNIDRNVESLYELYFRDILKEKFVGLLSSHNLESEICNKTVLVKPNLVMHPQKQDDHKCLYTNPNFILAVVEAVIEFKPKKIIIGDAPVQNCNWDALFDNSFYARLASLENTYNVEILLKDFRRTVWSASFNVMTEIHPISEYVLFDIGKNSFLEPITEDKNKFRVTNYNPDKLSYSHKKGKHVYCITKEFFTADIIIQLPKVKTHQKAGITNALKNLVGINGDKDFLPHHRIGGTGSGGDCYPGSNPLRSISEKMLDKANKNIGSSIYFPWLAGSKLLWHTVPKSPYHSLAAGWYGNDTTWRMVADLNKIAIYGSKDGRLNQQPVRKILTLCDGIIGGQGNGPLKPVPLPLGVILFSDNSLIADMAAARLMQFDISMIPLIREMIKSEPPGNYKITLNGELIDIEDLKKISYKTIPAPGWVGHIEEIH